MHKHLLYAIAASVATFVVGAVVGQTLSKKKEPKGVFVLMIRLKVKQGKTKEWLDHWKILADYCKQHEPNTVSYEASISDKEGEDNVILIYERYLAKKDLTDIHQKSAPFLEFQAKMKELDLIESKEGSSYYETNVGYM